MDVILTCMRFSCSCFFKFCSRRPATHDALYISFPLLSPQTQLEGVLAGRDPSLPVYLLGESFGGLVALALATSCPAIDRIVLVNPVRRIPCMRTRVWGGINECGGARDRALICSLPLLSVFVLCVVCVICWERHLAT